MKIIDTIKKKIALRKERKANGIGDGMFLPYIWKDKDGCVHVDGDLAVHGDITGLVPLCGSSPTEKLYVSGYSTAKGKAATESHSRRSDCPTERAN